MPDSPVLAEKAWVAARLAEKVDPSEVTKEAVGLANVDNTTDLNKPVSTATQTAINARVLNVVSGDNATATASKSNGVVTVTVQPAPVQSVAGRSGDVVLGKSDVGLSNVTNVAPADLPVSTATSTALAAKADKSNPTFTGTVTVPTAVNANSPVTKQQLDTAISSVPSAVTSVAGRTGAIALTKSDVGLANVDNTTDLNKPISTATQTSLNNKASLTSGAAFTGAVSVPNASQPGHAAAWGQTQALVNGFTGFRSHEFSANGTLAVKTGDKPHYNDTSVAQTFGSVRASVGTAPTGAAVIVDVKVDGTSIFTTANRPTIAAGSKTSGKVTAFNTAALPAGSALTVDIVQVGSTVAGADLEVQIETTPGTGGGTGPATTTPRPAYLTVASSTLSAEVRAQCDYACDGVNDQAEINAALLRASRPGDNFGGEGWVEVRLVGSDFSIANDNATCVTMYPNTILSGGGMGTLLTPKWSTNVDRGCIELLNDDVSHVVIRDLSIGKANPAINNGHGIKLVGRGNGDVYELPTGPDPFNTIDNVWVRKMARHGIFCTGVTGGCREMQIRHSNVKGCNGTGIIVSGSSDSRIIDCTASGNLVGFGASGGNTKVTGCKAYYNTTIGYDVSSTRCEINSCAAQDNGTYGFDFGGNDVVATGLMADSNSNLSASGAGFRINSRGTYSALHAVDRNQTSNSRQNVGFAFQGSNQVTIMGRSVVPLGGSAVTGTPLPNTVDGHGTSWGRISTGTVDFTDPDNPQYANTAIWSMG